MNIKIAKNTNKVPAPPIKYLFEQHLTNLNKNIKILDFGAGTLRNINFLKELGFKKVYGYDPYTGSNISGLFNVTNNINKIPKSFDLIYTSYVLCTVDSWKEYLIRKQIFNLLNEKIKKEIYHKYDINIFNNPLPIYHIVRFDLNFAKQYIDIENPHDFEVLKFYENGFITKNNTYQRLIKEGTGFPKKLIKIKNTWKIYQQLNGSECYDYILKTKENNNEL